MDFEQVRKITITALFSDDELLDRLVLKGGGALSLVYRISTRSSLDLDLSIEGDLTDVPDAEGRIFRALHDRFDSAGFVVFDQKLRQKPAVPGLDQPATWGGYEVVFKLIARPKFEELGGRLEDIRRQALVIGPGQQRVFTVDLSRHEYCETKRAVELDHYSIYVYTPEMIAIEKLRAICQQMPEYPHRKHSGAPRARDFYDIHLLIMRAAVDCSNNIELVRHIFAAKEVPLRLLPLIASSREFHRSDWPAVVIAVGERLEEFDFYFDSVLKHVDGLKSLWIEDPPV